VDQGNRPECRSEQTDDQMTDTTTNQVKELKSTDPVVPDCPACGSRCELHYQGTKKHQVIAIFVNCTNGLCLYRSGMIFDDPGSTENAERYRRDVVKVHCHVARAVQDWANVGKTMA
jgi:hypothetical protein